MVIKNIDYQKCNSCSYPADSSLNSVVISVGPGRKRGNCTEVCPMDVLRMDELMHKPVIRYPEDCMTCYNCEFACPRGAITVDPIKKPIVQVIEYNREGSPNG
jgi:NAD-dependent dihydropyrimidine dehydrogenase PreA subunit